MYIPSHFREEDIPNLQQFMRQFAFAALITQQEGSPFATHLPFLLNPEQGSLGALRAHMARANPQWRRFEEGQEALVIFQGPHAYISPSWYETRPAVPTWNYAAVHAYGIPRLVDENALRAILRESVDLFESRFDSPWTMNALSEEYLARMERGIVGFEMEITRLEGKFKLSQNRPEEDRRGVIAALNASAAPMDHEVADWMDDRSAP